MCIAWCLCRVPFVQVRAAYSHFWQTVKTFTVFVGLAQRIVRVWRGLSGLNFSVSVAVFFFIHAKNVFTIPNPTNNIFRALSSYLGFSVVCVLSMCFELMLNIQSRYCCHIKLYKQAHGKPYFDDDSHVNIASATQITSGLFLHFWTDKRRE